MTFNDPLQLTIRGTVGQYALRKNRAVVNEENRNDADNAVALRRLLRYGSIGLLIIGAWAAHLMGVS